MTTVTNDSASAGAVRLAAGSSATAGGLALAVTSAASFALSGPLARGLLESGWSVGAAVTVRIGLAAALLLVPALLVLDGRWDLLRRNLGRMVAFGVVAVAGVQFAFFSAVAHLQVGVAILVEYTAPVAVVLWFWWRHGHRPGLLTVLGGLLAAVGLPLVIDLTGSVSVDVVGLAWALLAMLGAAAYFVLSGHHEDGLPPLVLAAGGLLTGTLALAALGAVGLVPLTYATDPARFTPATVPWWAVVLALGLVTAAVAYTTGVAATRRLGSRLASFVALSEVLAAMLWAWALVGELPTALQAVGGVLVLAGVAVVKIGEPTVR